MDMMADLHGPEFELFQTFCCPADVGFSASSRSRTYIIGVHTERTSILKDPNELQETVSDTIKRSAYTLPQDYLVATSAEVRLEAQALALRRGIPYQGCDDLRYLLNPRERKALQGYTNIYMSRYGIDPSTQDGVFFFLGDNPSWSLSWSANGRLPTFRMNSGLLWSAKFNRWLTSKERLVSMAFPCTPAVAKGMAAPLLPATDIKRASDILGNSMHFLNTGVQQLIALGCFGPQCPSMDF